MGDESIEAVLASPVLGCGLELLEVERRPGLLRVVVDGAEQPADLDRIAEATRAVSAALDDHDPFPGQRYTLEVTTPGVERPLRTPRHFQRAVGELVSVRVQPEVPGDRRLRGTLIRADEDGFVLEGPELAGGQCYLRYEEVERARTVFEWGPSTPARPGSPRGRADARASGAGVGGRRANRAAGPQGRDPAQGDPARGSQVRGSQVRGKR